MKAPGETTWPVLVPKQRGLVKVYRLYLKQEEYYSVDYYYAGKRVRKAFRDWNDALECAKAAAESLRAGRGIETVLSPADADVYSRAVKAARSANVALDVAVQRYADAALKLGPVPLTDAVEYYLRRHPKSIVSKSVREVVDLMLDAKRKDGASAVYVQDLELRLGAFAKAVQSPVGMVDAAIVNEWLRGLECGGRTRNNYRMAVATLIRFAESHGFLPSDHIDLSQIARAKEDQTEIEIFTVEEMRKLLAAARLDPENMAPCVNKRYAFRQGLLPLLVLGGFAGMRNAEIHRQLWSDIGLDRGFIRVTAAKGNTAQKRLIPIADNLRAWLGVCRRESDLCCDYPRSSDAIHRLALRSGVAWKHNALRHSYCSYRVAQVDDLAKVALESGNSPRIILRNYRELVTPDDAKAWFEILP